LRDLAVNESILKYVRDTAYEGVDRLIWNRTGPSGGLL
jgi:hypothetical protein